MSTNTPSYNLYQPAQREQGWGAQVDGNFLTIDTALRGLTVNKANIYHVHGTDEVVGLNGLLAGKANSSHTHGITDITGLQAVLNGILARLSALEATATYSSGTMPPPPATPSTATGDFSAVYDHSGSIGAIYNFTTTGVTAGVNNYYWSFGDGSTVTYTNGNPFIHVYSAGGTYTASMTVSGPGLAASTISHTVTSVTVNGDITGDFTTSGDASPYITHGPTTFTPTSVSTSNGATITLYSWDFGDGATATSSSNMSLNHTYVQPGGQGNRVFRTATLTMSGPNLNPRTVTHTIEVDGPDSL
jgi:hypothetical protein